MELRAGYKQTEIGVIPEDWEVKKLGNITKNVSSGKSNTKNEIGNFYLYGSTGIIGRKTYFDYSGNKILIARVGANAGSLYTVNGDYCVSDNTLILDCSDNLNLMYNYYFLTLYNLNKLVFGSGQPLITGGQLKSLQIPLPPLPEQTAIATVLSDTDNLLQALEKKIAKKRLIKQGAMQELLKPKEDWVELKLAKVISFVIDNRGKTPPIKSKGYPLIEVNAIYKQGKHPNFNLVSKYVNKQTYENWFRDGHPQEGDILVVTVGSAGTTSFIKEVKGCIAQNIIALRTSHICSSEFLYYLTQTKKFKDYVRAVLMGGVQPSLKVPHIFSFKFSFPKTKEEQTHISSILSDMDKEIETLEKQLAKYKQVKQGLMQNLLTGKIRLV